MGMAGSKKKSENPQMKRARPVHDRFTYGAVIGEIVESRGFPGEIMKNLLTKIFDNKYSARNTVALLFIIVCVLAPVSTYRTK